jgi:hypothetical protein
MSDLPQADELPRAAEGYDAARVEEAFAAFGERVHELERVAAELRAELGALRADRGREDDGDWPGGEGGDASPDWIAAVPPPLARGRAFPRLVLEGAFLVLVAVLAGLADLSAGWIVAVMAGAWALVVLGEWASALRRASWHLDEIAPPLAVEERTGPWDLPVAAPTVIEAAPDPESRTVVAALPADASVDETGELPLEEQPQAAPKRRRFWRRRAVEARTADPWEA